MSGIKGQGLRIDIDMAQVSAMLPHYSIRKIAKIIGVHHNTLLHRLRGRKGGAGKFTIDPNPFCIKDRVRMRLVKRLHGHYFQCPQCGNSTKPPRFSLVLTGTDCKTTRLRGRPARFDIDMEKVKAMLPECSMREIARRLNIPFNTLHYRLRHLEISCGPNPFCVKDRVRMWAAKSHRWFFCPRCGADTRSDQQPVIAIASCFSCRAAMYVYRRVSGETYFRCRKCRISTLYKPPRLRKPTGGQLRQIDHALASKLLQDYPVLHVADVLGIHRNVLYNHISKGLCTGRPFRTWTPRPGWSPPSRDVALLHWPYMESNDPRYNGLIRIVNEAVPRTLGDNVRADVCQEIMVSVLTGEITEAEISNAVKDHLKKHYRQFPTKAYGVLSLDAPIHSDGHLRIVDTLNAESVAERIRDAMEANRLTESSPRRTKHFSRPERTVRPDIELREYDRLRRTYQFLRGGRVVKSALREADTFGGSWTVETALPDEIERL